MYTYRKQMEDTKMKMTIKEAYELIGNNCMMALIVDTTCEEWEKMDEDNRMKLAAELVEWYDSIGKD